jgi:hypothetical protein
MKAPEAQAIIAAVQATTGAVTAAIPTAGNPAPEEAGEATGPAREDTEKPKILLERGNSQFPK